MQRLWTQVEYFQFSHEFLFWKSIALLVMTCASHSQPLLLLSNFGTSSWFAKCVIACVNALQCWGSMDLFWGKKNKRYWKLDCGDVCHQSSATLSRWRQSPGSPTAPSHLTPHLYWNLNDTICALPRRKVWIWHFEFKFCVWNLVVGFVGASPSQDQYWSVNDTIWNVKGSNQADVNTTKPR